MLGNIVLWLFSLFWYCFGPFLLIAVAFSFFTPRPSSLWSFAKPIVAAITAGIKLVIEGCGALAEAMTASITNPGLRVCAAFALNALFLLGGLAVILFLATHQ